MNLYLFNAPDSAAIYGIGTYLKELTHALDGNGINVHVVNLHSARTEFEVVQEENFENWIVPEVFNQNTFNSSMQKLEDYCRNVIYLLRLHIKDTKDLVFHINYNHYHFFVKELKNAFDCKVVATVHFMKWALELQGNLALLKTILSKPGDQKSTFEEWLSVCFENEQNLYKSADQVIALAQYTKNLLQTEYHIDTNKIAFIPNGLEDISSLRETDKESLRKKWLISDKEFIILFVGRLDKEKGLIFLLKAFRQVLEKIPECRLIIAGSGNYDIYYPECEDIWTHVTWTGFMRKRKLYELYSIADIGIMPSFHEQCSYVAIEMMRHGLPLIGSTSTGLKEMIIDRDTGLHIPVIEEEEKVEIDSSLLAEKMLYLLQNPTERQQLGQNARRRYEECYSIEVFRENMYQFYRSLYE